MECTPNRRFSIRVISVCPACLVLLASCPACLLSCLPLSCLPPACRPACRLLAVLLALGQPAALLQPSSEANCKGAFIQAA